jgi:uncharacterized membrane protein YccC
MNPIGPLPPVTLSVANAYKAKILAKSLARIVGTLVGAIASFVLVNAFAKHGVLPREGRVE